ncbi:MAG: hypothetical protein ACMUIM_08705 [bacterium]
MNFIKDPGIVVFRRHYREGLRSQIMEILDSKALTYETKGVFINGMRLFPRAVPSKVFRIFKTRFLTIEEAWEEIHRVKIIASYLVPENMAKSQEFLVDYIMHDKHHILLCGLQEYVRGVILDPWSLLDQRHLISLLNELRYEKMKNQVVETKEWIDMFRERTEQFIEKIKRMIKDACFVPDLAGVGNLILTRSGHIKLVDINNISKIILDSNIRVDDRGYPVCDKSIEALSLLEQKLLGRSLDREACAYRIFLDPERMDRVKAIEKAFHHTICTEESYSD